MKKILLTFFGLALLSLSTSIASAQTTVDPADLIPSDVDMVYQFSTENPGIISDMIIPAIKNQLLIGGENDTTLFDKISASNTFTMAMTLNEDINQAPGISVFFKLNDEDLIPVIKNISEDYTTQIHNEINIYIADSTYITYIENIFAFSDKIETVKSFIDNYKNKTGNLTNNPAYKNALEHKTQTPFLTMYIDPSKLISSFFTQVDSLSGTSASEYNLAYLEALLAEYISISQTPSGFDLAVYVEGDLPLLEKLSFLFNRFNFIPSLYSKLSGTDLIFYSENSNLKDAMADFINVMNENSETVEIYNQIHSWILEETSVDLNDLLNLFDKNYMLTAHKTTQAYPAFTFMGDVSLQKTAASTLAENLNNKLKENLLALETESEINFYSYRSVNYNEGNFTEHFIDLKGLTQMESTATTAEMKLYLTIGVTGDGMFIVTTHPSFSSIYQSTGNGLLNNTKLSQLFTNPTEEVTQVFFFDIDTLSSYTNSALNIFEAPDYVKNFAGKLLAPWHSMYAKSYATANTTWLHGKIGATVADFATYGNAVTDFMNEMNAYNKAEYLRTTDQPFCDVNRTDWFHLPVTALQYDNIISGYPKDANSYISEFCFMPGKEITRAEFTKMIVMALRQEGQLPYSFINYSELSFSDISNEDWFTYYIMSASDAGLIKGYEDGTFRPNALISRAEAVEILKNAGVKIGLTGESEPFNDVVESDWFYNAVTVAYKNKLVNGVAPDRFEPHRNINRAEAAKIIYQFMELQ
jgi:hypothetical protein